MIEYVGRRLVMSVITLLGVSVIVFSLVQLLPGDAARTMAGFEASEEEVAQSRVRLGLDQPVVAQYGLFLGRLVRGDLGTSSRTRVAVTQEIGARLPKTLQLAAVASVTGSAAGILLGAVAARRRGRVTDHVISIVSVLGISMPVYWSGLLLIILFAVVLGWLPAGGADHPASIVLPALTLAIVSIALVARMTRASMLEVLQQDYIRTAHAKGVPVRSVVYRHALRNAFLPVLTVVGLQFGSLLGGAVLVESVFGWPGMGRLLVDSIFSRDLPVVHGTILIYALMVIIVNLIVDLLYGWLDPRIQLT